jgi:hypothetical protein
VGIRPFDAFVSPSSGNITDFFRLSTNQIGGGSAPYTVRFYLNTTSIEAGNCLSVPENGTCIIDTYLYSGYWMVFTIATDSLGNMRTSTPAWVNVTAAPLGATLTASLAMSPSTGDTNTVFNLTLTVSGGVKPYFVSWRDHHSPICSGERYDLDPTWSATERYRFYAGSHSLDVQVRSGDGQTALTNEITLQVTFIDQINTTAFDCGGVLGERVVSGVVLPYEYPPQPYRPLINQSQLHEVGADWLIPFFTPLFFSTIMMLGISAFITAGIAKYSGGQFNAGIVFGMVILTMVAIYGITGVYPVWVVIILELLGGLAFAAFFGKIFGGG